MTIMHFSKEGETEPVAIDVPDNLARVTDGGIAAARWVNDYYRPYQDSGLEAAEKDPEHPLSGFPDWAARGWYRLAQSANVAQVQLGLDNPENAAKDIQDYQNHLAKIPYSDEVGKSLLAMADADSVGEFWDAAATGPGVRAIGTFVGESFAQFAPAIGATVGAAFLGAGTLALAAITGLGSLSIEYGASVLSAMHDYLEENNQSISDDKAVAALFSNEEKMADFTEFGLKRGIPIGVIDGVSMGIAGKLSHVLRKSRVDALAKISQMEKAAKKTKVKKKTPTGEAVTTTEITPQIPKAPSKMPFRAALATEALVLQPGLGGLGEAVAQQVAGEEFKLGEVAMEMIGEVPGGTIQTGLGLVLQDAKDKKGAALKVKEDKKADILRARKGNEEVAFVNSDLNEGAVNPETGELESVQYETVAFNTLDTPVKAGERAFDREHIKNWFNGEIKQPRSKKLIIEYFLNKGYMEPVKGRKSQYQWTEAGEARNRQLNVESLEAAESVVGFEIPREAVVPEVAVEAEAEVVTLDTQEELDDRGRIDLIQSLRKAKSDRDSGDTQSIVLGKTDQELQDIYDEGIKKINDFLEIAIANNLPVDKIKQKLTAIRSNNVVLRFSILFPSTFDGIIKAGKLRTSEEIAAIEQRLIEAEADVSEPDVATQIVTEDIEEEVPGFPVPRVEEVPAAPDIPPPTDIVSAEELEIPGIAPEIAPPTDIVSTEELEIPGIAPEIAPPTAIPSAEELEVPGVAPEIAPPTAIPSAEELEVPELPMVGEAIEAELNNEEDLNYIEVSFPSNTGSQAFKEWFGASKVVDENGEPMVVYHGTTANVEMFDLTADAGTVGGRSLEDIGSFFDRRPFFFSTDPDTASSYAQETVVRNEVITGEYNIIPGGNVIPVYVSLQNPLILDGTGKTFLDFEAQIKQAARQGNYDGVIIRNIVEHPYPDSREWQGVQVGKEYVQDTIIAFRPEQIKSVHDTRFDPNDPRILSPTLASQEVVEASLSNEEREFVNETVAKYPKYIKDRIKPFKLRREGADRDLLRNEIDANIDMILTSQKIMTAVNRGKVSEEESEYLQKASLKDEEFINNIINESIVITNNADRQKQEEIVRQKIEKLSVQKIADDIFAMGLRIWHPVRMAEKYPAFRSFYQGVLMRREAREKYNNIGTLLAAPLYQDTSAKSVQTLSKVTALLDAFFSNRKSKSIFEIEGENQNLFIGRDRDGKITSLRLVIPEKAPLTEVTDKDPKTGEEVTIEVPVLDQVRYKTLLKGFKVEPGETIDLSKDEVMKFNASQDAFKAMFDIHTMAFVKHMLQITPLHSGIELRHDDSVANIKAKILDSASRYIDELNKVLPEESRIPENVKASLKNARNDSTYLNDLIDLKKSLPRSKTDTNVYDNALGIFKTILNQNQMLININQQQRVLQEHPFYMPRLRYGEFFFTIQDTEQKDSSGKPKTIGYYTETPSARAITPKQKRQNLEKIREEVLEEYSDPRFIVTNIIARDKAESKTHLDITTLHEVERLGKSIGYDVQDKELKAFFDGVKDRLAEVGFGRFLSTRDPDVISGYYNSANRDNYLPTVLSNYIRSAADTASNLEFVRPLRQSIELLKDGDIKKGIDKQPKLGKMADDMLEYINKPNEPGALFKSFAFHYALGLNLSSAAVNATQVLVTTVPLLRMILGGMPGTSHAIAIKEVSKGWKDSVKLMKFTLKGPESRLASYGFNFDDPNPPKHLTRGEWNMLRRMYQRGTIQAIVNLDLGAKYQQQLGSVLKGKEVTNKFAKGLAAAQDGSAFMFGAVEQLNRITTALAAYRIAVKSNKNLSRFQKFSQVTMFSDEKMTPEEAARMMVYKTQFFIGKENRPQLFRSGIMNVATQFLSFVMQYIGLYTQALNMFLGKEGKVNGKWDKETWRMGSTMLGSLTLSMVFFSGLMGLPYMENIRQMLRYLTKMVGTYEFDLEYGMREAMSSFLNPTIVDHLVHGSASKILGMDIRRRVGVGEPIPYTLMAGDLLAISGPAGSLAFDAGRRFLTAANQGNIPMMVTATMPLGLRAFVEGGMGLADPDKPVMTSRGKVMLPGKELSVGDRVKRMTGFTPGRVGLERKQKQFNQYIERAGKAVQDKILTKLAEKIYERSQEKSAAARRQLTQDIQEIRDEVLRQNRLYLKSGERHKLIRLTKRAIRDRIRTLKYGQVDPAIYKQRKRYGSREMAEEMMEKYTGYPRPR